MKGPGYISCHNRIDKIGKRIYRNNMPCVCEHVCEHDISVVLMYVEMGSAADPSCCLWRVLR